EPAGMTTIGLSYSLVKISTKCAPALISMDVSIRPPSAQRQHNQPLVVDGWRWHQKQKGLTMQTL
ncbi:hypothetical protein ACET85_09280, partial [Aeromonas veronii]|uniref:hypothetical protein n=1 Tax=Aeromonas veronii TaxID=654 RepID=UPI0038E2DBC5